MTQFQVLSYKNGRLTVGLLTMSDLRWSAHAVDVQGVRRFRGIIAHCVRLFHRFPLSLCRIELRMAERSGRRPPEETENPCRGTRDEVTAASQIKRSRQL